MAKGKKKSSGGGFGGFSLNRILTPKNALMTIGGAILAPKIGMDAKIGAAAGGYAGAGIGGAIVGLLVGVPAANAVSGMTGMGGAQSSATSSDIG